MVVVAILPNGLPQTVRRDGLDRADGILESAGLEDEQPVQMIGHDHEGEGLAMALLVGCPEGLDQDARAAEIGEDGSRSRVVAVMW